MRKLILWISLLCMLSCTRNPGLERTFQRAGGNRSELEKVLRHYEGDGRKHRAALFLLERMADCYGYSDPLIDSLQELRYLSSLPDRGAWTDSVKKVWSHVSVRNSPKVYDAQVISAALPSGGRAAGGVARELSPAVCCPCGFHLFGQ